MEEKERDDIYYCLDYIFVTSEKTVKKSESQTENSRRRCYQDDEPNEMIPPGQPEDDNADQDNLIEAMPTPHRRSEKCYEPR